MAWLASAAGAAHAQQPPIAPDRPGFTEPTDVVGPGILQFEAGWSYQRSEGDAVHVSGTAAPSSLLRLGFSNRAELRISTDGFVSTRAGGSRTSGFADLEAGFKIRLLTQDNDPIDFAVIPFVSLPTGSDHVSTGHVDPAIKLAWARDLPSDFGLSGNYNLAVPSSGRDRFFQSAISISLDRGFGGWGGFLESFSVSPAEPGGDAGWTFDTGLTRLLGPNRQIDVQAGRGLSNDSSDWFVGAGFAMRGHWHP